ncbi:MAG: hypothetical protein AAGA68_13060 [Pseudomonadota bacterium]
MAGSAQVDAMIRSVGVTNPVLPRRDSGGRGGRGEPEARPVQEETSKAKSSRDDATPRDDDREPPEAPHHIDEYA